jgi:UDP-glucose 4-epimerase
MLLALTGATGFIGQHLLRDLPKRGYRVRALLRRPASLPTQTASAVIGDLARPQNMSAALEGVDAVIHSAGLSHGMTGVPENDYRVLNTEATIGFARAARRAGAKRFIFLSSIRAQCGPTAETVLNEKLEPKPTDALRGQRDGFATYQEQRRSRNRHGHQKSDLARRRGAR